MEITRLTLKTVLNFGKHKGKSVEEVLLDEPSYILIYCIIKADCFVEGLKEYIDKAIKEEDNGNINTNDPKHIVAILKRHSLFREIDKRKQAKITLEDVFKRNEEKKKMYLDQME